MQVTSFNAFLVLCFFEGYQNVIRKRKIREVLLFLGLIIIIILMSLYTNLDHAHMYIRMQDIIMHTCMYVH